MNAVWVNYDSRKIKAISTKFIVYFFKYATAFESYGMLSYKSEQAKKKLIDRVNLNFMIKNVLVITQRLIKIHSFQIISCKLISIF